MNHNQIIIVFIFVINICFARDVFFAPSSVINSHTQNLIFTKPEALSFLTVSGSIQGTISSNSSFSLVSWIKEKIKNKFGKQKNIQNNTSQQINRTEFPEVRIYLLPGEQPKGFGNYYSIPIIEQTKIQPVIPTEWHNLYQTYQTLTNSLHMQKRRDALKKMLENLGHCESKSFFISDEVFQELVLHGIPEQYPQSIYGNPLQLILHEEFLAIASQAYSIKQKEPDLIEFIFDFDVFGMSLNRVGNLLKASVVADFCWKVLDCGTAVIEGTAQGIINVIDSALHPINTVQKLASSLYQAGNLLARIIAWEANNIVACTQDTQTYRTYHKEQILYRNAFLQLLAEQLQEYSLRDGLKEATTIGIETWLTGKGIHILAKWMSKAAVYAALLTKHMQKGEEVAVVLTGENIPAHVTQQATESLISAMEQTGQDAIEFEKVLETKQFAQLETTKEIISNNIRKEKLFLEPLGRGSTGRTIPKKLDEQLALQEIMSDPVRGKSIDLHKGMTDPRWPAADDWIKMAWNKVVNNQKKIEIHYVAQWKDGILRAVDDFKFKNSSG